MKVAAYCRVSTDSCDQLNSFENQINFFKKYTEKSDNWEIVKIYADEGITGTSTARRTEFNKMILAAMNGAFECIVTKEISRFARNTVDTLQYTRQLKEHGVRVIFINDNIDTFSSEGEFRLTIMASIAQEESRKTSERVKWGMRNMMKNGYVFLESMLGYDWENGKLTINSEEAKIVQSIYYKYVNEGKSTAKIAHELTEESAPLTKSMKRWSATTIGRIIKNEKYVGDLIQQKTYTPDFLNHKTKKNKGAIEKIYFKNHHEPIVSRELWDAAQKEMKRRTTLVAGERTKYSSARWCSGKVYCGVCGAKFYPRVKNTKSGKLEAWRCKNIQGNVPSLSCDNRVQINDRVLVEAVKFAIGQLSISKDDVLTDVKNALSFANKTATSNRRNEFEIEKLKSKREKIFKMYIEEKINDEEFIKLKSDISKKLNVLTQEDEVRRTEREITDEEIAGRIELILGGKNDSKSFYGRILESIIVFPNNVLEIKFEQVPVKFKLRYSTTGRSKNYRVQLYVV